MNTSQTTSQIVFKNDKYSLWYDPALGDVGEQLYDWTKCVPDPRYAPFFEDILKAAAETLEESNE